MLITGYFHNPLINRYFHWLRSSIPWSGDARLRTIRHHHKVVLSVGRASADYHDRRSVPKKV